jgi:hypothetical protein
MKKKKKKRGINKERLLFVCLRHCLSLDSFCPSGMTQSVGQQILEKKNKIFVVVPSEYKALFFLVCN